jgi:nitroimidazol reductase NimA-like FMN-containing flavoprotein (pyridoxamine 5'-phosphate oxidase superfamily)
MTMRDAHLEELSLDECLTYLRASHVGRIAVTSETGPVVLPVNHRLVETRAADWIALRTRPGNVIDRAPMHAAFEIDDIDEAHRAGWSVLVQGTLHPIDPDAADFQLRFDSEPWLLEERDQWLVLWPFRITGRRLLPAEGGWAFQAAAYL